LVWSPPVAVGFHRILVKRSEGLLKKNGREEEKVPSMEYLSIHLCTRNNFLEGKKGRKA
jgi:hypothetical protein